MGSILPKSKVDYLRELAGAEKMYRFDELRETLSWVDESSWSGIAKKELLANGYALEYQEGEKYAPEEK